MADEKASGFVDVVTSPARRARYVARGHWNGTTLSGQVAAHAAAAPERTAVVDRVGARRFSYRRLDDDANRLATWLAANGVEQGDVVSVQLPNTYETVVTAVGVLRVGAIINPLLPNYREKELAHIFKTARPKVVFTPCGYRGFDHGALVETVRAVSRHAFVHVTVDDAPVSGIGWADVVDDARPAEAVASPRGAAEVSELIFTSGTEATPKAIMHTEQTTNFSARVGYEYLDMTPDDVVWMPSPVGHSTGFNYGLRFALVHGLPLVLQDQWSADDALRLIHEERCSYTLAATTFLQDLVSAAQRDGRRLDRMRRFGCGGAPVPAELVRAAEACGLEVLRLYGSTEALVVTWNHPDSPLDVRARTDGSALPHIEVDLRRDDGTPCGPGEEGEIFTRGPDTCVGFFADPQRTEATFSADGFVRSGDLAVMTEGRRLTISGRKKEIIIRGGINIAPREIEDMLLTFAEIDRAVVVGVPDDRLGERMCACVVPASGAKLDLATVVGRLRAAGLATYKLPERLEIMSALPTTASGKVQKHEIVRQLVEEAMS